MENKQNNNNEKAKERIRNTLQPQKMSKKTAQLLFGLESDKKKG